MPSLCSQGGCSKGARYGEIGSKEREFCREHASEGMVDLVSKKCAHQDCNKQPSFGIAGSKNREFCREHATEGMTDLSCRTCTHEGCTKYAWFGVTGSKKRELCREHATDGMVDLKNNRGCTHQGCAKRASFGVEGSTKREFCRGHATEGMVDLNNRKCTHEGCTKYPSFGVAGTKKLVLCKEHAVEGMVDLISKKCAHGGCTKQPSFGAAGSKKREFCKEHAQEGMVTLISRKCAHRGCTKEPSFGVTGGKKREFCREHALHGMIYLKNGTGATVHGPSDSAARSIRSEVRPTSTGTCGSGSRSIERRPAVSQSRKDHASSSTQPTKASSRGIGKGELNGAISTNDLGGQPSYPLATAGTHAWTGDRVAIAGSFLSPPISSAGDNDIARRGGSGGRGKRRGGPLASAEQTSNEVAESGKGSSKRARRTGEGDVVILDSDDQGASSDPGISGMAPRARVAIKPERVVPAGGGQDE